MRSRPRKTAHIHEGSTKGIVTQSETGRVVALTAQLQQIFRQSLRLIEFVPDRVIMRLTPRDVKELGAGAQLLPQRPCSGIGIARFRCGETFDDHQGRGQTTSVFEFLSLAFGGLG